MERQYTGLSRDVQKALEESGGSLRYRPDAYEITRDLKPERIGIWEVLFPEGTTASTCYLWTPKKTEYILYSPSGAGSSVLVEPKKGISPSRSLYLLTTREQEKYGLSLPLNTQGYPEISLRDDGVKEVVVPAQCREGGRAIFLDGFGTGRPGFDLVYVLFTYHPSGQREIYLIPPSEKDNASRRYTHLHEHMPAQPEPGKARIVMAALDYHLKEAYGIDWEQELRALAL